MRSYPIWNNVTSCIYKGSKSYGAKDTGEVEVCVGTSTRNSEVLIKHFTTRRVQGDNIVFKFGVEIPNQAPQVLTTKIYNSKTKEWSCGVPGSSTMGVCRLR